MFILEEKGLILVKQIVYVNLVFMDIRRVGDEDLIEQTRRLKGN